MRIISPFNDYYDCVQSQGQDLDLTYIREPKRDNFKGRAFPFPICVSATRFRSAIVVVERIIGFCGKIYPALRLQDFGIGGGAATICYKLDDVDAFVRAHCKKREWVEYFKKQKWHSRTKRQAFECFFEECEVAQDQFGDIFRDNRAPIFVAKFSGSLWEKHAITYNASLRELEFYRVFDPFTAFQEIAMYLGGVLGKPTKPIPEADDRDLADAKGFDNWSFRKPPTKKGR